MKKLKQILLSKYTLVIVFGVGLLAAVGAFILLSTPIPNYKSPNGDPRNGRVCEDTECTVVKVCQNNDLLRLRYTDRIRMSKTGGSKHELQTIEKSIDASECRP